MDDLVEQAQEPGAHSGADVGVAGGGQEAVPDTADHPLLAVQEEGLLVREQRVDVGLGHLGPRVSAYAPGMAAVLAAW